MFEMEIAYAQWKRSEKLKFNRNTYRIPIESLSWVNPLRSISNAKLLLLHLFRTANAIILNMKKKQYFYGLTALLSMMLLLLFVRFFSRSSPRLGLLLWKPKASRTSLLIFVRLEMFEENDRCVICFMSNLERWHTIHRDAHTQQQKQQQQ